VLHSIGKDWSVIVHLAMKALIPREPRKGGAGINPLDHGS
jgi:hypothetical protein